MRLLEGKTALIVGGARGMGAAEARLFAEHGASVMIGDVLDEVGEATAGEIDGAEYRHLDVSAESDWEHVVASTLERFGRLDIMVNNAGMYTGRQVVNLDQEQWQRMIAVNQTGTFLGLKVAGAAIIGCGNGGSIVAVSSVAGLVGNWGGTAYCGTKWAVRGMARVAAKEFGPHGVRVNSIYPGYIQTDMLDRATKNMDRDAIVKSVPLGRIGEATEIASVALFLASEMSSYCTGQEFVVDGGLHG